MRERFRSDRGASIFMLAISLFLLIGASAIAVDIAAIWLDRSTDQKVTDTAAAVGVLEAANNGGEAGCQAALIYVAVNTADLSLSDVDLSGCVEFSDACTEFTSTREKPFPAGRYELTVVHPVEDDHDLMTSRIIGRQPQDVITDPDDRFRDDGDPCDRVGVKMTSTRNSLFAQVLGFGSGETTVHTVANRIDGDRRAPFNLLVLDRTGCETISVSGGGALILDAVLARDDDGNLTGGLAPGFAAADSDGSACGGGKGVINLDGGGSLIRADGPEVCDSWTGGTHLVDGFTAYEGCGKISVFAPGTPGCNPPACNSGGGNQPAPPPTPLGRRYTRQVADHTYNCHPDYTIPPLGTIWAADALTGHQSIDGCDEGTAPHIYNLIGSVKQSGTPDGFGDWELWTDLYPGCNVGDEFEHTGNVVVNCNNLQIPGGKVVIHGNVVFNGNVKLTSTASFTVNTPADQPWVFFRGGELAKSANGSVFFPNTMVYMSKDSSVSLAGGGDGKLVWTAPTSGRFDGLALWSDSPKDHKWAGQSSLVMEGVFFMPLATAQYTGNGNLQQTEAQWIAWRLKVSGNGALRMAPNVGKALQPFEPRTVLIR